MKNMNLLLVMTTLPMTAKADLFKCMACTNKPANAHYTSGGTDTSNCSWSCDSGYTKNDNLCCANKPDNSSYSSNNCGWNCNSGYASCNSRCIKDERIANSSYNSSCELECNKGYKPVYTTTGGGRSFTVKTLSECKVDSWAHCATTANAIYIQFTHTTEYGQSCASSQTKYYSAGTSFNPVFRSWEQGRCAYVMFRIYKTSDQTLLKTVSVSVFKTQFDYDQRYIYCDGKLQKYTE